MLVPCAGCFGEDLLLHEQKLNGSILYTLKRKGEPVIDLWKETVNVPSDGKPMDRWCRLVASDENHNGALALIENNEAEITLIQFDRKNAPLSVLKTLDPGWLKAERKGAKLTATAPNRITLAAPNQEPQSWSVVDGRLIEDGGNALDQGQTLKIGSQRPEVPSNAPAVNTGPAVSSNSIPPVSATKVPLVSKSALTPSEEPAASTPWSIIVILIVAAMGLLWLLLKRRS